MRLLSFFLPLALCAALPAQNSDVTIRSNVQEVLLDLVVRDKHERLTQDLKPGEIEIYVDGARQQVKSFRLVSGKQQVEFEREQARQAREDAASGKTPAVQKLPGVNLVAIVFAAMSPRSRDFAREAAIEFLKNDMLPNTYAAVFSLDYNLNALQEFTNNTENLIAAVDRASTGAYSQFPAISAKILNQIDTRVVRTREGPRILAAVDAFKTGGMSTAGAETSFTDGARIISGILHRSMLDSSYMDGMRTMTALLTMTREMARLPGRKTILYMSEGLAVPPHNSAMMQTTISEANRSNVSFYMIDTRGLTTYSVGQSANAAMEGVVAASRTQTDKAVIDRENFRQDDSVLYTVRAANTQGPMGELAENTGGFLIANTNSLKKPMAHIMEDVRTHYELTFVPAETAYDGRFRKIEVKLLRSGLHAQSRSGYYALPFLNGETVLPYDVPALDALNAKVPPRSFEYRASAFRFRPGRNFTQCAMTFEVPIANLKIRAKGKTASLHASLLALIKDPSGQVVGKISRDIPYEVPADKLERFRQGNLAVSQPFELPDGNYTVETAVVDHVAGQASTRRSVFTVYAPEGIAVSSLVLARSIDSLNREPNPADPLEFQGGKVTPSLADSAPAAAGASIYLRIYPLAAEQPELTLEFSADGVVVGRDKPELPSPDATGAIPVLTRAQLKPGSYIVTATAKQGNSVTRESSAVVVE